MKPTKGRAKRTALSSFYTWESDTERGVPEVSKKW